MKNHARLLVSAVLCATVLLQTAFAADDVLDRATLKLLYTYQFGKFTQWPDRKLNSATSRFRYCILGKNPFSQNMMNMIRGKSVQGIPLVIDVFDSGIVPEEVLAACHVLYISQSEKQRLSTILSSINNLPVLTVSDIRGFSRSGGMVTLKEEQGNLRFQINPESTHRADVTISSKILELAEIVTDGKPK